MGTPYIAVLNDLGWPSVTERLLYLRMVGFYKIFNKNSPQYLIDKIQHVPDNVPLNIRSSSGYHLRRDKRIVNSTANSLNVTEPFKNARMTKIAYFCTASIEWNNLDRAIKGSKSLGSLKHKLK
jgi:hypothetical protein